MGAQFRSATQFPALLPPVADEHRGQSSDWFVEGSGAATRPLWLHLNAGVGIWGGAQPGLYRLDAGPRAPLRVGQRMRVHLDHRQRLTGNVLPGSGAVVTVAGDF